MSKFRFFPHAMLVLVAVMLLAGCNNSTSLPEEPGKPGVLRGLGTPSGFAATMAQFSSPLPLFSVAPDSFTLNQGESVTIDISTADSVIYKTGYYSLAGEPWQPFDLTGGSPIHNWLAGTANASLTWQASDLPEGSNSSYVVLYSCTWDDVTFSWDCHDRKWQIYTVTSTVAGTCSSTACEINGTCYPQNSAHPQENQICLSGTWVSLPGDPGGP